MATRLGIIETFQETLEICWRRLPALVRICWAPSLFFLALYFSLLFLVILPAANGMPDIPSGPDGKPDPAAVNHAVRALLVQLAPIIVAWMTVATLIVATMVGVPISRLAGAGEEPEGFIFVRWSARHTRFAAALVAFYGLQLAATLAALWILADRGFVPGIKNLIDQFLSGQMDERWIVLLQRNSSIINFVQMAASGLVIGLLLTLAPAAAIENRIRFFGALKTGALNLVPILASYILLCLSALALTIAAVILYFVAAILVSIVFGLLKPVMDPAAFSYLNILAALAFLSAVYVFNVFYAGLFFAFPAIVYRRLSPDAAALENSGTAEMRVQSRPW